MVTYSNFSPKVKSALRDYEVLLDRATSIGGTIDGSKTFATWHKKAIEIREVVKQVKQKIDEEITEIKNTYQPSLVAELIAPLNEKYNSVVKNAKQRAVDALEIVVDAKMKALEKSADAPSEETIRLLTALKMRDSVSAAEITDAAGKVGGNIHALKILGDLAKKNDLFFPSIDMGRMREDIDRAEQFATNAIESIGTPDNDLSYKQRLFWTAPGAGEAQYYFGPLDNQTFTATIEKTEQNDQDNDSSEKQTRKEIKSGYNATKIVIQGYEKLIPISMQFGVPLGEIKKANPDVNLDEPLYSGMELIIPATHMRYSSEPGSVSPDACLPTHYTPAKTYNEGQEIEIS